MSLDKHEFGIVSDCFPSQVENTCTPYVGKTHTQREADARVGDLVPILLLCIFDPYLWIWSYELIKCPFCLAQ